MNKDANFITWKIRGTKETDGSNDLIQLISETSSEHLAGKKTRTGVEKRGQEEDGEKNWTGKRITFLGYPNLAWRCNR